MAWEATHLLSPILLVLLASESWTQVLQTVEDQTIFVKCKYVPNQRLKEKILCQRTPEKTCNILVSSLGRAAQQPRYSIRDHPESNFFTVTMTALRMRDSGLYHCGIHENHRSNIILQSFHLVVSKAIPNSPASGTTLTWTGTEVPTSNTTKDLSAISARVSISSIVVPVVCGLFSKILLFTILFVVTQRSFGCHTTVTSDFQPCLSQRKNLGWGTKEGLVSSPTLPRGARGPALYRPWASTQPQLAPQARDADVDFGVTLVAEALEEAPRDKPLHPELSLHRPVPSHRRQEKGLMARRSPLSPLLLLLLLLQASAPSQIAWVPHNLDFSQTQSFVSQNGGANAVPVATVSTELQNSTLGSDPPALSALVLVFCGLLTIKSLILLALLHRVLRSPWATPVPRWVACLPQARTPRSSSLTSE
ncbi:CMRF35-like molecule 9 [Mesocricetus auratus]|uniref:CMRF35-like molecule 9 n=1 Tax=Mesocricetus auratus TaxID=10036 RepID=A0ABM2W9M7_MESAU|nr:CMRF35-like molecule 9 [Mesocricetus auratus]